MAERRGEVRGHETWNSVYFLVEAIMRVTREAAMSEELHGIGFQEEIGLLICRIIIENSNSIFY